MTPLESYIVFGLFFIIFTAKCQRLAVVNVIVVLLLTIYMLSTAYGIN